MNQQAVGSPLTLINRCGAALRNAVITIYCWEDVIRIPWAFLFCRAARFTVAPCGNQSARNQPSFREGGKKKNREDIFISINPADVLESDSLGGGYVSVLNTSL